jgi:hypothetical protein
MTFRVRQLQDRDKSCATIRGTQVEVQGNGERLIKLSELQFQVVKNCTPLTSTKLRGLSPPANYTDLATATCRVS